MGGRVMPHECKHGVVLDWGDFGPSEPEELFCERCEDEQFGYDLATWHGMVCAVAMTLHKNRWRLRRSTDVASDAADPMFDNVARECLNAAGFEAPKHRRTEREARTR